MVIKKIIWDIDAKMAFKSIIQYIKKDSPQNAEKVKKTVLDIISDIPFHPTKFSMDKYKSNKDFNFRAFEIFYIRVSYFIDENNIRIVRIRSTHQAPLSY